VETSPQSKILMLGNDPSMAYLIGRYAHQSGFDITAMQVLPVAADVCAQKPAAILFTSVESLEAAQLLIAGLSNCDIPVLVCSSVADEARARELGADHCLLHPLTYEGFHGALTATSTVGRTGRKQN
jgi:CheY-like chemotaxis protein